MGSVPYMLTKRGVGALSNVSAFNLKRRERPPLFIYMYTYIAASARASEPSQHTYIAVVTSNITAHHVYHQVLDGSPMYLRLHRQANTRRQIHRLMHRDFLQAKFLISDTYRTSQDFMSACHMQHEASARVGTRLNFGRPYTGN